MMEANGNLHMDLDQLPAYLEGMMRGAEMIDFTPAFEEIVLVVAEGTRENFDGSHDPQGNPWPPAKGKLKVGKLNRLPFSGKVTRRLLVLTGNLMRHACDHVVISGQSLQIAPSVFYGLFHQTGTSKMPKRQFLGWNDKTLTAAGQIIAKHYAASLLQTATQATTKAVARPSIGRGFLTPQTWAFVR